MSRPRKDRGNCVVCGAALRKQRKTYCSRACMAKGYAVRLLGTENPNYRDLPDRPCQTCGKPFRSYNKARKFCSDRCKGKTPENIARCRQIASIYSPTRGKGPYKSRRDANHAELAQVFALSGAAVMDTTHVGGGFPDLVVGWAGAWHLVEIKNPNTKYGRNGLTPRQQAWAAAWKGGGVHVARTVEDVRALLEAWTAKAAGMTGVLRAQAIEAGGPLAPVGGGPDAAAEESIDGCACDACHCGGKDLSAGGA